MDSSPGDTGEDEGDTESSEFSPPENCTTIENVTNNNNNNNNNNINNVCNENSKIKEDNARDIVTDDSSDKDNMNNHKGVQGKYALVSDGNFTNHIDIPFDPPKYGNGYENGDIKMAEPIGHINGDAVHIKMGNLQPVTNPHDEPDPKNVDNNNESEAGKGDGWSTPIVTSWKRQWLSTWYIYIVILTPILLLPIILMVDDTYRREARCGYVIAIMAVYWTTEALPISVTALLPVVLLPMLGVMTARETSAAFFNDVSMVFVGGLLVAIAIEVWDVHKRIALLTVRTVGAEPKLLLLGITLVTWFLSMWISNTATTAMMMTIVQALLDQYKEVYRQRDARRARRNSDATSLSTEMSAESQREYSNMCKAVCLTVAYAANIGGTASLTGTGPNIIFFGAAQQLFEDKGAHNPVTFGTWMAYGIPMSLLVICVQWVWMVVRFLRCRGFCSCFAKKSEEEKDEVDQVNAVIAREYEKLGPVSYAQKTILVAFSFMVLCWVSRDLGGSGGWGEWFPKKMVTDSTPSIFFGILMFILPSRPPRIRGKGGWRGRFIQVKPLLNWNLVHQKMPWSLYIVLGGGYSIAKAATQSGLSAWLGKQLLVFQDLNNWVIVLIVCYVVAFATEVTSNSATATLMMPILSQMAISLQVNPLLFMFPAAIATSFAFMLPAATPPNAIVFSSGAVRVIDMFTCGLLLNLMSVPILLLATSTWGNALFHFDTMPPEFRINSTIT